MAKAKGRDLVLEMMTVMEELKDTARQQADQLEAMSVLGMETVAAVTALAGDVRAVISNVNALGRRVNELSQGCEVVAASARTHHALITRLATLIGDSADHTVTRLNAVEGRVTKLERKVG